MHDSNRLGSPSIYRMALPFVHSCDEPPPSQPGLMIYLSHVKLCEAIAVGPSYAFFSSFFSSFFSPWDGRVVSAAARSLASNAASSSSSLLSRLLRFASRFEAACSPLRMLALGTCVYPTKGGEEGVDRVGMKDHTRGPPPRPPACAEGDMGLSRRVSARPRHSASHDEEPAALVGGFEDGWPGRGGAVIRRRRRRV